MNRSAASKAAEAATLKQTGWQWLWYFAISMAVWTVVSIPGIVENYTMTRDAHEPIVIVPLVFWSVSVYWTYALISMPIFWLSTRLPLHERPYWKSISAHALAFPGVILAYASLRGLQFAIHPPDHQYNYSVPAILGRMVSSGFFGVMWAYLFMVAGSHAIGYSRTLRQRELQAAELNSQIANYELQILKLQLHPHFLFNCLNGISALMSTDVPRARTMMARLSDLLRSSLRFDPDKEISLKEELEFIDSYLSLQQMRLGERLRFSREVEPETLPARVPNMVLQPLVENAIRHGVESQVRPGAILLRIYRQGEFLRVSLTNDGASASHDEQSRGTGVGLTNVRARLRALYGDKQEVAFLRPTTDKVEVTLQLPFRIETAVAR